jgi:peptide-methionine (R)-S-oxide reductase
MRYEAPIAVACLALLCIALALVACDSKPAASTAAKSSTSGADTEQTPMATVTHTDAEWRKILTPEQYAVLRQKNTDRPFTGKYDNFYQPGTYSCAACGQELFSSDTKFDAGCGWPSFFAAEAGDRVKLVPDYSMGMARTEVVCARCGSHLGHLFTGETHEISGTEKVVDRYCINSTAIKFTPAKAAHP